LVIEHFEAIFDKNISSAAISRQRLCKRTDLMKTNKAQSKLVHQRASIITFFAELLQNILAVFFLTAVGIMSVSTVSANPGNLISKTMCIYDPVGANGPVFTQMKDYQVAALDWGAKLTMKAYTDERVVAEDFKAGACDLMLVTGFKGREFNPFTGTLDSIGSMPSYEHLKVAVDTLSGPKAQKLMQHNGYEVIGLMPAGAAYLYVNDRSINSVADLSGKRIGILSNDPAQKTLVLNVGASPIGSSMANLYPKFNNGAIDICAGPAVLYDAMELYKGIGKKGGIIKFPLAQLTMQLIIKDDADFTPKFRQSSRDYASSQFTVATTILKSSEDQIPSDTWIDIPNVQKAEYEEMLRQARLSLKKEGVYDGKMLTLMRKIRCKMSPTNSECSAADKE